MAAVVGIAGFVGELAFLHERDADEEEHGGHGDGTEDEPVNAAEDAVHQPNAPPEKHLAEVVGMPAVFPEAYVAAAARVGGAEVVNLLVGNELDGGGRDADQETENEMQKGETAAALHSDGG